MPLLLLKAPAQIVSHGVYSQSEKIEPLPLPPGSSSFLLGLSKNAIATLWLKMKVVLSIQINLIGNLHETLSTEPQKSQQG